MAMEFGTSNLHCKSCSGWIVFKSYIKEDITTQEDREIIYEGSH